MPLHVLDVIANFRAISPRTFKRGYLIIVPYVTVVVEPDAKGADKV